MPEEVSVANLRPGQYLWHRSPQLGPVAVFRLSYPGTPPPGSVAVPGSTDEYYVAFSPRCTHLGCLVITPLAAEVPGEIRGSYGVLVCPCHSSNFDLMRAGMAVQGPATDGLPRMKLGTAGDPGHVTLDGWSRDESVPYGVPFGETSVG